MISGNFIHKYFWFRSEYDLKVFSVWCDPNWKGSRKDVPSSYHWRRVTCIDCLSGRTLPVPLEEKLIDQVQDQ